MFPTVAARAADRCGISSARPTSARRGQLRQARCGMRRRFEQAYARRARRAAHIGATVGHEHQVSSSPTDSTRRTGHTPASADAKAPDSQCDVASRRRSSKIGACSSGSGKPCGDCTFYGADLARRHDQLSVSSPRSSSTRSPRRRARPRTHVATAAQLASVSLRLQTVATGLSSPGRSLHLPARLRRARCTWASRPEPCGVS